MASVERASLMAHSTSQTPARSSLSIRWIVIGGLFVVGVAAFLFQSSWLPAAQQLLARLRPTGEHAAAGEAGHEDAGHAAHGNPNSIELSPQARKNIGLTDDKIQPIKLQPFTRSITIPGMVVERPGRSVIEVTAPFTGHIDRIFPSEGESLKIGQKLFNLRLTHEELVQTQATLLQTAVDLEVIDKEVARLEKLSADGAIAGKRMLELKYERGKKESLLEATRQALLLHGISKTQVATILSKRELFKELTITVGEGDEPDEKSAGTLYQVQSIKVAQGQHVEAGTTLMVLADHAELYIQGEAFERDVADINRVADDKSPVTAVLETDGAKSEIIDNLQILYLASQLDPQKRTLDFYVTLPNKPQRDSTLADGRRFFSWKYRPGQRVQLEIPAETLPNRIVLPIEAIAQDATETYVFTPNGNNWERRSVHVEYRDQRHAVIANDGALFPGDRVALTGAQQLQVAVKNKSGGAPDPHAGHSH
jgi:cobalt-zinc-cadmium efflux system membrane fusion protein